MTANRQQLVDEIKADLVLLMEELRGRRPRIAGDADGTHGASGRAAARSEDEDDAAEAEG